MENQEKKGQFKVKYAVAFLLGIVLIYALVTSIVDNRLGQLEVDTRIMIEEQESLLATISETTARNGADSVTESIIRDCPITERSRFDELLGQLDSNLSNAELLELDRLFGRCGSFYSERKSLMVARLGREFQIYQSFVTQLETITGTSQVEEFKLADWEALVGEEQKQSEAFTRLVTLQGEIITELVDGNQAGSDELVTILENVRETQESLLLANKQAKDIRAKIISF